MIGRRNILAAASAAVVSIGLTGFADAQTLSVGGIYGGVWADSIRQSFLNPFAAKSGVKLQVEEGISGVTLAKLRQQKGNPQFDVVWMDRVVSDQAIREDLIEPISPEALTNLKDIVPEAVIKDSSGRIMALTTGYWAAGLAYNKQETKQPPQSWQDLANPVYKGRVAVYSPENSICFPFLVTLAESNGGSSSDLSPAFKMMAKVGKDGGVFFGGSPAGANLLANGEVSVAMLASSQVWDLQSRGFPIEYVVPKEGAIAGDIRVHIVKGTKNKAAAEKLADYAISADGQSEIAKRLLLGPVNTKVTLAPEIDRKMPWGANGSVAKLRIVDPNLILDKRDEWAARWNQEVAR
jgi:putative spermidine/putrescine transport system substrate-binding protein